MKISELIKTLKYELESSGDSEIKISIDTNKKIYNSTDLRTCLDIKENGECVFIIQNYPI